MLQRGCGTWSGTSTIGALEPDAAVGTSVLQLAGGRDCSSRCAVRAFNK
jgi:hypothetical protein